MLLMKQMTFKITIQLKYCIKNFFNPYLNLQI